jgi:hypothetical protein
VTVRSARHDELITVFRDDTNREGVEHRMTDEELIEAAAKAMQERMTWPSLHWPSVNSIQHDDVAKALAVAALEVFREALKPTGDEREALADAFARVWVDHDVESGDIPSDYEMADAAFAAGFTRARQDDWEYSPGYILNDGYVFVQSGVIAPRYVQQFMAEGGEVIRRRVGKYETVHPIPDTEGSKK